MNKRLLIIGGSLAACAIAIFLIYRIIVNSSSGQGTISVNIDNPSMLLNKAKESASKGNDDSAINALDMLIAKYPTSPQAESAYLTLASIYEKRNDLLKARELYQGMIEKFPNSNDSLKLQEALDSINIKILFSPIVTQDSFVYEVQKGDSISKLAKKFNTTIELISKSNNIKDGIIRIGSNLKIAKNKFSIVVDKSQNILTLKSDGNILKTYKVSTGKDYSTPLGTFKITSRIIDPTWYTSRAVVPAGSPKNILGTRWLGISKPGYGIHGTTEPQSIGKQVTAGCVRMTNADIEELYSIVPEGTEIVIVD